MAKFCTNCGKELNEEQDVCLGCGKVVLKEVTIKVESKKKDNNHNTYKTTTGIVMIVLGFCLLCASGSTDVESPVLVYTLPGLFGLIGGILNLNTKKNPNLLIPAAVLMFLGAVINFLGIIDISIFAIVSIVFGIFNIIYAKKEN